MPTAQLGLGDLEHHNDETCGAQALGLLGEQVGGDLWRITVNDAGSLLRLIATIRPFSLHATRRAKMDAVVENVEARWSAHLHRG